MAKSQAYNTAKEPIIGHSCANTKPLAELTEHDKWLCNNPAILASVMQGLSDSAEGRVSKRKSYAEHADDILED